MGALEASRDTETGKEASMAAPFPGPTAEQGAWVAIAEQGARADSGDHGGSGELWRIRGLRGPWRVLRT